MNKEVYKVGDKLVCIPDFKEADGDGKPGYGGGGYKEGRIITVREITYSEREPERIIYWPKDGNKSGIYGQALKLYQPDKVINDYSIY